MMVWWKHVATIPAEQRKEKKEEIRALMAANDCSHLIANDVLAKTDINPANLILEPHDDNVDREYCGVKWRRTYDKMKVLLTTNGATANHVAIHLAVTEIIHSNSQLCAGHENGVKCHFICYDSEEMKLRHDRLVDLYESYLHPPKPSTAAATTASTSKKRSRASRNDVEEDEADEEDEDEEAKGHSHSEEDTIMTNELGGGDDDDMDTQAVSQGEEEDEASPAKKPRRRKKDLVCSVVGCGMTFGVVGGGGYKQLKQHEHDAHQMHEGTIPKCGYVCPYKSFVNLEQHRKNNGHGEGDRHKKTGRMKAKVTEPQVKCDPCTAHERMERKVERSHWSRHKKSPKHKKALEEYKKIDKKYKE